MPEDQIPEMLCLRTFSLSPPADVLGYSGTALLYWNTLVLLYCTGIVYREGGCGAGNNKIVVQWFVLAGNTTVLRLV